MDLAIFAARGSPSNHPWLWRCASDILARCSPRFYTWPKYRGLGRRYLEKSIAFVFITVDPRRYGRGAEGVADAVRGPDTRLAF